MNERFGGGISGRITAVKGHRGLSEMLLAGSFV
jgi:hypothetical protein